MSIYKGQTLKYLTNNSSQGNMTISIVSQYKVFFIYHLVINFYSETTYGDLKFKRSAKKQWTKKNTVTHFKKNV